ncbi:hypothetical protein H0H81_003136 [Sphagnurus paluster]|uniref:GH16 domain-containing protein n=1 Tax=Sphagnurus paluster TaxID=117069 RepID=A0A9P7FVE0_9AGAR|nr:hypothetical protein H0H81_003136 [Sphagnurus paluster]
MRSALVLAALLAGPASAIYVPLHEYAGSTFFDGWDFWGNVDNTTWGNVTYLDRAGATAQRLAYVNSAGNAIIKVDNTTNIALAPLVNRPSVRHILRAYSTITHAVAPQVRLTSKESYGVGTLWLIDVVHMPYGCSVWPSFWTLGTGKEWPGAGEIDIIEGINLMSHNQMALHATAGCAQAASAAQGQSGTTLEGDCSLDRGCIVAENKPNSFGVGFANAGGGVWAVQMDVSGVFIWFWSRPQVPDIIRTATSKTNIDTTAFGLPSAAYPAASGCNITQYFGPQQFVLLTTLCGSWAGVPNIYSSTCPGQCVSDNVIGPGSPKYDTAYWEIPYIRTYIADNLAPPAASLVPSSSSTRNVPTPSASATGGNGTAPGSSDGKNAAKAISATGGAMLIGILGTLVGTFV